MAYIIENAKEVIIEKFKELFSDGQTKKFFATSSQTDDFCGTGSYLEIKKTGVEEYQFKFHAPVQFPDARPNISIYLVVYSGRVKTRYIRPARSEYIDPDVDLEDGALNLRISVGTNKPLQCYDALEALKIEKRKADPMARLLGVLAEGHFSDLTLECEGQEFPCHRIVLAAHSIIFEAMLKNQFEEAKTGKVKIEDTDKETLRVFLKFVYTQQVDESDATIELFALADKYDVRRLATFCDRVLSQSVTVDNAAKSLMIADRYNAPLLKEKTLELVLKNFEALRNTPDMAEIVGGASGLMMEMMSVACKKELSEEESS